MTEPNAKPHNRLPAIIMGCAVAAWIGLMVSMAPPNRSPVVCGTHVTPDAKTVVMLSASWCGYCRRARAFMQDEGIAHCEYDVETSSEGRREYAAMPVKVVPVIKVGDETLIGFSRDELERTLFAQGLTDIPAYGD